MAAVRHLGFVWDIFGPFIRRVLVVSIIVQNLVVIGAVVLYESFDNWRIWLENAYSGPQNCFGLFNLTQ